MFSRTTSLTQAEITSAIIRSPLIVTPDTMVMEAIAQMSGARNLCQASNAVHSELVYIEMRSSCVIVIEDNRLVGILTERDVVRLITQKPTLENILIRDVMTRSVVTLHESDFTDLFFAVNLLQQHHIRHLPLIDDHNCLTGLLTHESLRQTSRPADLLRLRLAKDVMTTDVVCAEPQVTMRAIARLMTDHQVSSVMIVQPPVDQDQVAFKIPIGIVTERDVVQFQALGLKLEICPAQAVMSMPIFGVQPDDSLWVVQNLMEQRRIQRLAVIGAQSELLGIVTQSSLLQILNPLELYKLAEVLEDKVLRLEAEKIEILENRTIDLERQVEERTATLKAKADQEYLIATVVSQIRLSLELPDILNTTVEKVRAVLGCDRVAIWQIQRNQQMLVIAESTSGKILSLLGKEVYDPCFAEHLATNYTYGHARIVPDIYTVEMADCHRALLEQLQTRAKILIPIIEDGVLWGLLEAAESHKPRQWEPAAVDLLQQLATQLAIAIQQTTAYQHLQVELHERRLAEQRLEQLNAELERRVQERTVELQRMNQELARATRLKDEFLANMSHELRTPLNAILGMTEGLQEEIFGIVNEKQTKALHTLESSATHLLSLINDILDVAKIESGQIRLEHTSISVSHLFSSSLPFIKQLALQKRIQLEMQLDEDLTDLLVDELRIRQVLINLLTNAVKFTREGGKVMLTAARLLDTDGLPPERNYLRIAVIDNGIGITPENINKLFRPFVQIDSTLNRQHSGTGLGLALVKQIVELHGGRVELTSELGAGSCFKIDLPCQSETIPEIKPIRSLIAHEGDISVSHTELAADAPLIMLAEDNLANISTIAGYLEAKGYRILLAYNGQEAIDLAKSEQPDLILMDIQMPGVDGLEAMQRIRQERTSIDIPIIALTALAMKGDRERCLEAGANDYLSKPVKLKQLAASIHQYLTDDSAG
jgi:signal transduction histidine kinase/CBS domain-containing protein/ActR/RegA family two-component response regulator